LIHFPEKPLFLLKHTKDRDLRFDQLQVELYQLFIYFFALILNLFRYCRNVLSVFVVSTSLKTLTNVFKKTTG
jgi:hypothetical protein